MRKSFGKGGLVVLAAGLIFGSTLSARADESAVKGGEGVAQMDESRAWEKGGWEDTCTKSCDLTDDQKTKLKAIFKKQRESTQPLVDQIRVDMDTLKLKVDAKASDDDIKTILVNLDSEKDKLATVRDGFEDKLDALLTPTQEAKFLLAKSEHDKWGKMSVKKHDGEMMKKDEAAK
jgi:Spy/CpxP family protein refolding chaperone